MRFWRVICPVVFSVALFAQVPAPKEHFGFDPGDDYKLANSPQIHAYFEKLAKASNRIRLEEFGKSSEGRPMFAAFISSEENLRRLDGWKVTARRLALGQAPPDEARQLASEGRVIVWIDSGLHASEVAPAQHAPHLAYRMITGEDAETRRIRDNVILIQVPVINPDGLNMVADWYAKNVGTPFELAPMPWLYQKYAGHDNNRDYFMLNLAETRHVSRMLFREWFPQIVYNQHQMGPNGARFEIPPYADPLNPNIPAAVMQGINFIGAAIHERLAAEGKGGVLSQNAFDAWWNGGLRSAPAFHNMHGILTEAALYGYATPKVYTSIETPERWRSGLPAREPNVFAPTPWKGGRWGVRESIEYMLSADIAILELAASRREQYLFKSWEVARQNIEAGKSAAYVVPKGEGWDAMAASEMVRRLQMSGVEVKRDRKSGTYVIPQAQAFRAYLVDLMEPQKYPEIRMGQAGPTKRPYDIAGWTLPMQMGVKVEKSADASAFETEPLPQLERAVEPWTTKARVGIYEPWNPNMDTGWTRWMLDEFGVKHDALRNADIRKGGLRARYDVVILAQQSLVSMLHGYREGESAGFRDQDQAKSRQRPEYEGGIEVEGAGGLLQFVREGGTLLAFDSATQLPLQLFPIGVRGTLSTSLDGSTSGGWYCPGSLLRVKVDTSHPLAKGMPAEAIVVSTGGEAFDIRLLGEFNKGERATTTVVRYADANLLASGWVSGERAVLGKPAMVEARIGKGRVVLYGFRPQFRGQSWGTFRLILNALAPAQ